MTMYYFFDEYGELIDERDVPTEDLASEYCDRIGADMFCSDEN